MREQGASMQGDQRAEQRAATGTALFALVIEAVRRIPRTMSLTSLSTLSTLERTGPRRITDLAVIEGVTQPSMTTLVKVLERDGMVERRGDPSDGRVALVAVTEAGSDLVRARRRTNAEAFAQLIDKLSDEDAATLAAAIPALERLRALSEGSSRGSGPPGETAQ
jgi:DNA-binding MarR family transcriptional regulator